MRTPMLWGYFLLLIVSCKPKTLPAPSTMDATAFLNATEDFKRHTRAQMPQLSEADQLKVALNAAFLDWAFNPTNRQAVKEVYAVHFDPEAVSNFLRLNPAFLNAAEKHGLTSSDIPQYLSLDLSIFDEN